MDKIFFTIARSPTIAQYLYSRRILQMSELSAQLLLLLLLLFTAIEFSRGGSSPYTSNK